MTQESFELTEESYTLTGDDLKNIAYLAMTAFDLKLTPLKLMDLIEHTSSSSKDVMFKAIVCGIANIHEQLEANKEVFNPIDN